MGSQSLAARFGLIRSHQHARTHREGTPLLLYFLSDTSLRILRFSSMQNSKSFLKTRILHSVNCETGKQIFRTLTDLFDFKCASIFVVLTSKHFAKIPEILKQQVIKSKARRGGICYPGLDHITSLIGRSRCQDPWLLSCALIGQLASCQVSHWSKLTTAGPKTP